jgi:hypothetical protein
MLVAFSAILALFLLNIFSQYVLNKTLANMSASSRFIVQALFIVVIAMFGYAGPTLSGTVRNKLARETVQDVLLGIVIGAINGYFIIGSILYFLHQEGYPFPEWMTPPPPGSLYETSIKWLAPAWLKPPLVFFAVGLSFVIVIILFV